MSGEPALVYLNNGATSHPKPACVVDAVHRALTVAPCEAGRSAGGVDLTARCRAELAGLLGVERPEQVVITPSATYAINTVVHGCLRGEGGHAVTTSLEHNSVLRPLARLAATMPVTVTHIEADADSRVDPAALREALRPDTRLVCVTHASNVTGSVQPVEEIAAVCAERGIALLVDAAQSVGCVPIDHAALAGRVFLAIAGHKALLGPPGVGALVVPDDRLPQTFVGGTGVRSDLAMHPPELPLRHEAGTPNHLGIAGLTEGVRYVREHGVAEAGAHRAALVQDLREGLRGARGLRLTPLAAEDGRAGIVSFALEGWSSADLAQVLLDAFGIVVRGGLHCAPRALPIDLFPDGTVRASFGSFSTPACARALVAAVRAVAGS